MTTMGFHNIALVTSDAAQAIHFYRDVLGIDLLKQTERSPVAAGASELTAPATGRLLYFGNHGGEPGTLITVREHAGVERGHPGAGGIHHFALGVDSPEAQLKWKRRLQDHGVRVSGPYNRGWFHSIYFTDADGQIVEIATRGPGYAVDEAADALGRDVVIPPGAELRGMRDEAVVQSRTHPEPVPVITPDMRLDGLHHISGLTDDVEQIGDFYEAALGLRLVKRSVNQDDPSMPHWFWANYDGRSVAPRSSLTMFGHWSNGDSHIPGRLRRAVAGIGQTHAIAFRAADANELRTWQERIRSLGVDTSDVLDHTYYHSIMFRAPDGMLMEIATDAPGFALEEAA